MANTVQSTAATNIETSDDLRKRLRFITSEGEIWLDEQRMMLLHLSAFASFRRELVDTLGTNKARDLLTRMGYAAGSRDAELARRTQAHQSLLEAFSMGPRLHAFEGLVAVDPVKIDVDVAQGVHYVEQIWRNSAEGSAHLTMFGLSGAPVCWMQVGYASGYNSAFFGRSIVFRETQCCGMGHAHCRIVGRPAEEWRSAGAELSFLQPTSFINRSLVSGQGASIAEHDMIGASPGFVSACHQLQKVAPTSATVLFLGETGVGKEKFARMLHRVSPRSGQPFVAVNCGAIPESLIESELFGVEKGAFTGALEARAGRFERADGGTLFLDEIGTLHAGAQQKLLRVLQEREVERVGSTKTRKVDIRLVVATNSDLREEVARGRFREDLYYRINVVPIRIPALRDRRDDIPLLTEYFTRMFCEKHGRSAASFTMGAVDALLTYDYPGNIRELENIIERSVIMVPPGEAIDLLHLFTDERMPREIQSTDKRPDSDGMSVVSAAGSEKLQFNLASIALQSARTLSDVEQLILAAALAHSNGNVSEAARLLGLSRRQVEYRLKK